KTPAQGQLIYVGGIDPGKSAVSIPVQVSVVGQPVARLRIQDSREVDSTFRGAAERNRISGDCARQTAEVGNQILQLARSGLGRWHQGLLLLFDGGHAIKRHGAKCALKVL